MSTPRTEFGLSEAESFETQVIEVGDLAFSFHESGRGRTVVLLHSGEFGASAATSWARLAPLLANDFRVIAPDWLGYGNSAKIFDFEDNTGRRLRHLRAGLAALGVTDAHFVGTSLGGTMLLHAMTRKHVELPIRSCTLLSSGGAMPASSAREVLTNYNGSREGMRKIIEVMFHDAAWSEDEDYVDYRWNLSQQRGAWEAVAAARFHRPDRLESSDFGRPDTFAYEEIEVPVLAIGGDGDKLKPAGYLDTFVPRIPHGQSLLVPQCAHSPNLEHPEVVTEALQAFFASIDDAEVKRDRPAVSRGV